MVPLYEEIHYGSTHVDAYMYNDSVLYRGTVPVHARVHRESTQKPPRRRAWLRKKRENGGGGQAVTSPDKRQTEYRLVWS
jgi:hypothetical protein